MLRSKAAAGAIAALLALGLARGAAAGDGKDKRITVTARGQAVGVADAVEIEFTVTAHTEECVEAEKKFRDKVGRVEKALKEGDVGTAKKKSSSDDDDDETPVKKKKPANKPQPPKATPKKKAPADDDDDDEDPAPKKKDAKKDESKKDESKKDEKKDEPKKDEKKDEPKKDEPKKDEPKKDEKKPAEAIPIEISQRNLSILVRSSKSDDTALARAMAGRMGVQPEKNDSPMYFSCKVVATIADLKGVERNALTKRIASLIDLGIDAGADGSDGDSPVVRFICKDGESLRKAAYKDAVAKAKKRAQEIAELTGASVGDVASVNEAPLPTSAPKPEEANAAGEKVVAMIYGLRVKEGSVILPTMDLTTEVELRVEFELK